MKKTIKGLVALLLSLLMIFGAVSVPVMAYDPNANLYVNDIYKVDYDAANLTCYTIAVMFSVQFKYYNSSIRIDILGENGSPVAYCVPRTGDVNTFDIYTVGTNASGIKLNASREYTLLIPEGAFYTDGTYGNRICNEYRHIFTGVDLSGANYNYTVKDLGMASFLPTSYTETVLKKGKLNFDPVFELTDSDNCTIILQLITTEDGSKVYTKVGEATVLSLKNGCAELSFGASGVTIDKYASYRIVVSFASFYNLDNTFCAESVYNLSGKKLLKLREDYPFIDMLIELFGKDNTVIDVLLTVLEYTSKVTDFLNNNDFGSKLNIFSIPDITAYYKDVKAYIAAK